MICVNVEITRVTQPLEIQVEMVCGLSLNSIPLLVDEGYLLVDFNGDVGYLYVNKQ